jgi:50S ribosomal subunit-associated GTPase HflX
MYRKSEKDKQEKVDEVRNIKNNLEKVKLLARDLRNEKEFPRSPRETLAGYVLAAHALDKCRADLVG